ncbi:MAG: 1-deoxy-D-xylulose-5-phosphate synthase [Actinomycetaceae bacterium]|nr:1-deoxy-D-xylulose-5-phosphate synthase [Arcanobacterium sp.]MDD7505859.1 1-deoxy-D-xylulose-5-phosphate synthase [Actinomycetaceae bacterium]MDY6142984.1 1-deoxy-D-xylulose-5-phosphate synthase [Arcanobacterium sp.]
MLNIQGPHDLQGKSIPQLEELAREIRRFLVSNVSKTGGHLGPNLGVVELTIALHRVFDSPTDAIVFDTGHQSYVHKILTGRTDFSHLRQRGGISGYPSREESEHDIVENSHASTALSWADGIARAKALTGTQGTAVAVIGDGAMTGGMAWEALNNISEGQHDEQGMRPLVIVLNDNGRSYQPTVGGIIRHLDPVRKLDAVRVNKNYEQFLQWGKRTLKGAGAPGQVAYGALRSIKRGMKEILIDAGIFDSLGLKYLGPINGHDIAELEEAFAMAKHFGGPVVVHVITEKGRGYKPAEDNSDDHFHAIGKIHPETGLPLEESRFGWTSVFAEEIVKAARQDESIVGVTAAMMLPVGLGAMKAQFPERVFDVGIAEAHAMTMSAGLARGGMHPVVALYSTFMNRGFDQLLMDIALHHESVTVCLDRSGITGDDGASHNGMWDLSLAAMVPGLKVAVPRDAATLRSELNEALAITDGPTLLRYPKGSVPDDFNVVRRIGSIDVLYEHIVPHIPAVILVGIGAMTQTMIDAARVIRSAGRSVIVVDPRWVLPINEDLVHLVGNNAGCVVLEDGLAAGGIGTELSREVTNHGSHVPVIAMGIAKEFIQQGKRVDILHELGMDADEVVRAVEAHIPLGRACDM